MAHLSVAAATGFQAMDLRSMRQGPAPFTVMLGLALTATSSSTGAKTATCNVYVSNDPRIVSSATTGYLLAAKAQLNAAAISLSVASSDGIGLQTIQTQTLVSLVSWNYVALSVSAIGSTDVQVDAWVRA